MRDRSPERRLPSCVIAALLSAGTRRLASPAVSLVSLVQPWCSPPLCTRPSLANTPLSLPGSRLPPASSSGRPTPSAPPPFERPSAALGTHPLHPR
ncbi:hypothetical protein K466DRAFT_592996, partial [Polyporus arcularius HHB13444]